MLLTEVKRYSLASWISSATYQEVPLRILRATKSPLSEVCLLEDSCNNKMQERNQASHQAQGIQANLHILPRRFIARAQCKREKAMEEGTESRVRSNQEARTATPMACWRGESLHYQSSRQLWRVDWKALSEILRETGSFLRGVSKDFQLLLSQVGLDRRRLRH